MGLVYKRKKNKMEILFFVFIYIFNAPFIFPFDLRLSGEKEIEGIFTYEEQTRGDVLTIVISGGDKYFFSCAKKAAFNNKSCMVLSDYKKHDKEDVRVKYYESKDSIYFFKKINKVVNITFSDEEFNFEDAGIASGLMQFLLFTMIILLILVI